MRTTVTLEPDVEVRVKRLMTQRGLTFKAAINEVLRAGLDHERAVAEVARYVLPARRMGIRSGIDIDRIVHLDADLEDDETRRRLNLAK
ncbi:MAG: antitoxin [Candidatus Limnocylindrales bacterium]